MPNELPEIADILNRAHIRLPRPVMDALKKAAITVPHMPHAVRLIEEEISPVFATLLTTSEDYIPAKDQEEGLAQIIRLIQGPAPVTRFAGLTGPEQRIARETWKAYGASVATPGSHPELAAAVHAAQATGSSRPMPRLIRVQSDLPLLRLLPSRNGPASLLVSDDMLRIQSQGGLQALLMAQMEKAQQPGRPFGFFRSKAPIPDAPARWSLENIVNLEKARTTLEARLKELAHFFSQVAQAGIHGGKSILQQATHDPKDGPISPTTFLGIAAMLDQRSDDFPKWAKSEMESCYSTTPSSRGAQRER